MFRTTHHAMAITRASYPFASAAFETVLGTHEGGPWLSVWVVHRYDEVSAFCINRLRYVVAS